MTYEFMREFLNFMYMLGGAVVDASRGVIDFLQRKDLIPGYSEPLWMFITGLFLTIVIPWILIKWFNPL